ncbi:MAG: serpin family protein [Clostridia bacterium]|nr:serpin family protein [Clostridia bacterium]
MKRAILFILLISIICAGCTGCALRVIAADCLSDGYVSGLSGDPGSVEGKDAADAGDFALELLRQNYAAGDNVLLSPLSVLAALSMTANGAKGQTLSQMEQTLGFELDELNRFFRSYLDALATPDSKLRLADSVWFSNRGGFTVNKDFLQTNADYYGADIFSAPFDEGTLKDINSWVSRKTNGMIENILDEIPVNAVMYVINALAFEAEWEETYDSNQIFDGVFTTAGGNERTATFMHSDEHLYLQDEGASGFVKYYSGGRYAFAALLPDEGVSTEEYLSTLTGEKLLKMLQDPTRATVVVSMPKFEVRFKADLAQVLKKMGMSDAFDEAKADFTGLGQLQGANVYIGRVLHETFISVAEKGTRAGAATAVEMVGKAAPGDQYYVTLDRPFIYLLFDTQTQIPFFIGTLADLS